MEKDDVILDDNGVEIGKRVKRFREYSHLTQKELAEQVMISPSSITRLESGKTMVSVFTMVRISEILNVPISKILTGSQSELEDEISGIEMRLEKLMKSDPEQCRVLIRGIEQMIDAFLCFGNAEDN